MPRLLYRIVGSDPPTLDDFRSYAELGRAPPRRAGPELLEMWTGVSTYDRKEVARAWALERPQLGRYIATLRIEEGAPIRIKQTGRQPEHFDLWADAAELLARVIAVEPV